MVAHGVGKDLKLGGLCLYLLEKLWVIKFLRRMYGLLSQNLHVLERCICGYCSVLACLIR